MPDAVLHRGTASLRSPPAPAAAGPLVLAVVLLVGVPACRGSLRSGDGTVAACTGPVSVSAQFGIGSAASVRWRGSIAAAAWRSTARSSSPRAPPAPPWRSSRSRRERASRRAGTATARSGTWRWWLAPAAVRASPGRWTASRGTSTRRAGHGSASSCWCCCARPATAPRRGWGGCSPEAPRPSSTEVGEIDSDEVRVPLPRDRPGGAASVAGGGAAGGGGGGALDRLRRRASTRFLVGVVDRSAGRPAAAGGA